MDKRILAKSRQARKVDTYEELVNQALFVLQENSVPDKILCRDEEKQIMRSFFENGIESNGNSQSICKLKNYDYF
jgi:hypothetical protein